MFRQKQYTALCMNHESCKIVLSIKARVYIVRSFDEKGTSQYTLMVKGIRFLYSMSVK